jgi:alkylation response protein AidB-like acyl-CoA dehydrogenase
VDFAFNEDQELLRATTRKFLDDHGALAARRAVIEADEVVDRDEWRRGAELGWTAMLVPPERDGGSVTEQPLVDLVVLGEELGRVLHPGPFVPANVVADALARAGPGPLQDEHLAPLARGERLAGWCATGDGSADAGAVEVTARESEGGLRLDGVARYVHGATAADVLLVAARIESRLALVVVPLPHEGVTVRPLVGLDLTRRFAEVRFDDVPVASSSVLVGPGKSADEAWARAVALATVLQSAEMVGAADFLVATTVQYAKDRVQFGRPIGSFQAIKHRLADLFITVEAMRAATHYAGLAFGDGYDDGLEAVHVAGAFVGASSSVVCGEALQLHGGIGFTWEHDVHLFLRRAKASQQLYGNPAWHREKLCALVDRSTPDQGH